MLSNDTEATTFVITDTKLYALVVTLSTQYNAKLFEQLKTYFQRTINWNKYKPKVSIEAPNTFLDFLMNPSFQGVNILLVLSFEHNKPRPVHTKHFTSRNKRL